MAEPSVINEPDFCCPVSDAHTPNAAPILMRCSAHTKRFSRLRRDWSTEGREARAGPSGVCSCPRIHHFRHYPVDFSDVMTASPPPFIHGTGALEASGKRLFDGVPDDANLNQVFVSFPKILNRRTGSPSGGDHFQCLPGLPGGLCKNHFSREL